MSAFESLVEDFVADRPEGAMRALVGFAVSSKLGVKEIAHLARALGEPGQTLTPPLACEDGRYRFHRRAVITIHVALPFVSPRGDFLDLMDRARSTGHPATI